MRICGPNLSVCGVVLSIWGMVQLTVMSFLFRYRSVALFEDVGVELEYDRSDPNSSAEEALKTFWAETDKGYIDRSNNCLIAALLYIVTLCFSLQQYFANRSVQS